MTAAAAYIVASWLLLQIAATVFPLFDAPAWVLKVFTTVLVLGLPIAVILAWARDQQPVGSPEAGKRDSAVEQAADPVGETHPRPPLTEDRQEQALPANGIAVMPFASLSTDVADEHMADGISEEIINALAQLPGLKVVARTSAFSFKGKDTDLKQVGAALGVGRVLEGSLRRVGDQLRVTAQLIDVADGYQLWSERYDRQLVDIFAIQDEIAQSITQRIHSASTPTLAAPREARHFTANMQAYELYLKGKWCWAQAGTHLLKAIDLMDQARTPGTLSCRFTCPILVTLAAAIASSRRCRRPSKPWRTAISWRNHRLSSALFASISFVIGPPRKSTISRRWN